jgi:hypothetical protein
MFFAVTQVRWAEAWKQCCEIGMDPLGVENFDAILTFQNYSSSNIGNIQILS